MNKLKSILNVVAFGVVMVGVICGFFLVDDVTVSKSERRMLKQWNEVINAKNPLDEIEGYLLDQFPQRESMRKLKSYFNYDIFAKKDNNKLYFSQGSVVKLEDKLDENQLGYAINNINKVIEKYAKDSNVYISVIPDKHCVMSKANAYPAMDYNKLFATVKEKVKDAEYIDITDLLTITDYYNTDSHWKQEKIIDVAQKLLYEMYNESDLGVESDWEKIRLSPFYGVYYGQVAKKMQPEIINCLKNEMTDNMKMTVIKDNGTTKILDVYVKENFENIDPYDVYCDGAQPLVIIENPMAESDRELVVFRDSFGSSIAPLLACGYSKITLVDLRYMVPDWVGNFVNFKDVDVLFLYSTGLLNGGRILKDFMN